MSARENGPGAGLIGVILPYHDDFDRPYYEPELVPLRLHDFIEQKVAIIGEYEEDHVAQPENSSPVEVLRYLMEENAISTRQMSRILGKDESIVSKILKGERSITLEHARKLAHHFAVNPGLFLQLSDK